MTAQWIGVALAVALAAGYLVRTVWITVRGRAGGCGSGCGKCAAAPAPARPAVGVARIPLPTV